MFTEKSKIKDYPGLQCSVKTLLILLIINNNYKETKGVCSPERFSTDMFKLFEQQITSINVGHVETFHSIDKGHYTSDLSKYCKDFEDKFDFVHFERYTPITSVFLTVYLT